MILCVMMASVIFICMTARPSRKLCSTRWRGLAVIETQPGARMENTSCSCSKVSTAARLVFIMLLMPIYKTAGPLTPLNYRLVSSRPHVKNPYRFYDLLNKLFSNTQKPSGTEGFCYLKVPYKSLNLTHENE